MGRWVLHNILREYWIEHRETHLPVYSIGTNFTP